MKSTFIVVSCLLVTFTSCVSNNFRFADRNGGLPHVKALETARQAELEKNNKGGLGDVMWLPLLTMKAEIYNEPSAVWPKGTGYADYDAYGPLFMFADSDVCHYDEQQRLYERNLASQYLWGLYKSEQNEVRVPTGWRVDHETSLLFGLLRWPETIYVESLPYDAEQP